MIRCDIKFYYRIFKLDKFNIVVKFDKDVLKYIIVRKRAHQSPGSAVSIPATLLGLPGSHQAIQSKQKFKFNFA